MSSPSPTSNEPTLPLRFKFLHASTSSSDIHLSLPKTNTVREVKSALIARTKGPSAGQGQGDAAVNEDVNVEVDVDVNVNIEKEDDLRLVWGGRILRDEEVLEEVFSLSPVGMEEYTIIVSTRPSATTLSNPNNPSSPSISASSATNTATDNGTRPTVQSITLRRRSAPTSPPTDSTPLSANVSSSATAQQGISATPATADGSGPSASASAPASGAGIAPPLELNMPGGFGQGQMNVRGEPSGGSVSGSGGGSGSGNGDGQAGGSGSSEAQAESPAQVAQAVPTPIPTTTTTAPASLIPNPAYFSTLESLTWHSHLRTNSLLTFLSQPIVSWDQQVPKPRFEGKRVGELAGEVLRVNGIESGEGGGGKRMEEWEEEVRRDVGERGERGEEVFFEVEMGDLPYKLMIPNPEHLTQTEIHSLASYKRYDHIIQQLDTLLTNTPMYVPLPQQNPGIGNGLVITSRPDGSLTIGLGDGTGLPAPNGIQIPIRPPQPPLRRIFALRILLPSIALLTSITTTCLFSLFKVSIVLWMFTRGLAYSDPKFIAMCVVAAVWWVWDCVVVVRKVRERVEVLRRQEEELRRVRGERLAREAGGGAAGAAGAGGAGAGAAPPAPAPVPAVRPAQPPQPARNRNMPRDPPLAHAGLPYDRRILRLFYFDNSTRYIRQNGQQLANNTALDITDFRIPTSDRNLPGAPRPPSFFWRYLILPLLLLVGSVWPGWEAARRKGIREREEHMRLLVKKMTDERARVEREAEAALRASSTAMEGQDAEGLRQRNITGESNPSSSNNPPSANNTTNNPPTQRSPIIPTFLGPHAIAYYRRVLSTNEAIDWEEERRAQAEMLAANGGGAGEGDGGGAQEQIGLF